MYQDKLNLVVCFKPMSGYENWASTKIVTQIKNGQEGDKNNHLAILLRFGLNHEERLSVKKRQFQTVFIYHNYVGSSYVHI